jgi:hypothetical protein
MYDWKPFPKQELALKSTAFETLFGGARGGGKTAAGQTWLIGPKYEADKLYIDHPLYRALVLRKNYDDLVDWLDRAENFYSSLGGTIAQKPAIVSFPSGALFRTGHLKDRSSYEKYLGHEYQRILIEEVTLIPQESYYIKVLGSCRSTIPELKPKIFLTTNPDGPGHAWVKRRFVDPAPHGQEFIGTDTGRPRVFIPSTIDDNPVLVERDPGYVKYLDGLKVSNEELWKAWRVGDWNIFIGQVFTEFMGASHVIPAPDFPLANCKRLITFDWGYNAPGCALWLAVAPEDRFGIQRVFCYRELYQNQKTPEQWADEISVFTKLEKTEMMILPRDCFASPQGGRSIASVFQSKIGTTIIEGESLTRAARINRQAVTHQFLSNARDGRPNLYILERCRNLIRTLPELVYDEVDVELVDSEGEDHAYDSLGMGLVTIKQKYKLLSGPVRPDIHGNEPGLMVTRAGKLYSPDFWEEFKHRDLNKKGIPEK